MVTVHKITFPAHLYSFFLLRISRAAIFASPRTMPEFVVTASGHRFSAAFRNIAKSSSVIFTFTWTVRFMPPCIEDLSLSNKGTRSTISTRALYYGAHKE